MGTVIHGCSIGRECRELVHVPTFYVTRVNRVIKLRVNCPRPLGLRIALLGLQTNQPPPNNLPLSEDIMIKILQLLPLESVLACKCVSKQWKNVINGPEFMEVVCRYKFTAFFHTRGNLYGIYTRTPHDNEITNDRRPSRFVVNRILGNILHTLPGSSEKIVCVKVNSDGTSYFVSYDSFTRKSYVVKDAPLQRYWRSWIGYGFGYDRRANDHKIVVVCPIRLLRSMVGWLGYDRRSLFDGFDQSTDLDNIDCSVLFVYSFRKRGWKSFKGFRHAAYGWWPSGPPNHRAAAYGFNGVLHWVLSWESPPSRLSSHQEKRVLGALDLHTCTFAEIELPSSCDSGNVAELDGRLCYCVYGIEGSFRPFDLWVMNEYGVGESWTKLLRIRFGRWPIHMQGLTPTLMYRRGDGTRLVLFVHHFTEFSLFWYDMDKETIQAVDETG